MDELLVIGVIAALIGANGLFVAAEFAIIAAFRPGVQARAQRGDRLAKRVAWIQADPVRRDRYIATAQLGITLASLGLGMYGEHAVARWILAGIEGGGWGEWAAAHATASLVAITALTYLHVVFGEMVPKSLALQRAEETALWVSAPMLWMQRLFSPVVLALNGVGNGLLRLFGLDPRGVAAPRDTPEELEILVGETQQKGQLGELPGRMMRELFDFFELTAEQVMVPRVHVVGLPLGCGRDEAAAVVARELHTRYPVYENDLDHVVGFVHAKDLGRLAIAGGALERDAVRPAPFVPGSLTLDRALDQMVEQGAQLAVILDEHGGTAGILTVEDLFEELVGDLEEDEAERLEIVRLGEGAVLADGTARLEEVAETLGVPFDHEEVETVSGLVLALLGRPPVSGDRVEYGDLELRVVAVEGRGVAQCQIRVRRGA